MEEGITDNLDVWSNTWPQMNSTMLGSRVQRSSETWEYVKGLISCISWKGEKNADANTILRKRGLAKEFDTSFKKNMSKLNKLIWLQNGGYERPQT